MKKITLFVVILFSLLVTALSAKSDLLEQLLEDVKFEPYHGFLRYLEFRSDQCSQDPDIFLDNEKWKDDLSSWMDKIQLDPLIIEKLDGTFEWAYQSKVDNSGQPFKISVPKQYDPQKSYPLSVYLHGFTGDHIEHTKGMQSHDDYFQVGVHGRSRGGYYQNLSEVDVLDVINYVSKYWNIDPQRIHLNGGSMGGWGTFFLTNRYPHRFASARPTCGYAVNLPLGNWLHVPFYSIHSVDDYVVPVVMSRVPMQELMNRGGQVILDETVGYGHASWDYEEGQQRAKDWFPQFVAPRCQDVENIDYTAFDGSALRGYWGEIIEWGPVHQPARFVLNLKNSNFLNVKLENVSCLQIAVDSSPIDPAQDLTISYTGMKPIIVQKPIADNLFLVVEDSKLKICKENPRKTGTPFRFPGGARNLYSGEPLLIVWGTQGDENENCAMEKAALSARRSSHPKWGSDKDRGSSYIDGVPFEHLTYGLLAGKADVDVTDEDMQSHHLVVIGNERQNLIARKLSGHFPVRMDTQQVVADDGMTWGAQESAIVFNFKNPFSENSLVSWIACDDGSFYQSANALVQYAAEPFGGMDLVVFDSVEERVLGVRNFNSRWEWENGYSESPEIGELLHSEINLSLLEAKMAGLASDADYYIFKESPFHRDDWYDWESVRLADLLPFYYAQRFVSTVISGERLNKLRQQFERNDSEYDQYNLLECHSLNKAVAIADDVRVVTDLFTLKNLMGILEEEHWGMSYVEMTQAEALSQLVHLK